MLVIDQLPASLLGPYGNTMIETASFNRLAAQSLVFDFAFAESLDLKATCRRIWSSLAADAERVLISDDSQLASLAQEEFDRVILIEQSAALKAAASSSATQLANFFAQASAWIAEEMEPGQFCWIHSRGLGGDWDAPYELRQQFAGEDDPAPPHFVASPSRQLESEVDPDELLGYQQAAAAQVLLLDDCLSVLLDQLEEKQFDIPVLLVCASTRGCGLGEHGLVGIDQQLHSEAVQIPLMIRFPASSPQSLDRLGRSSSLVSLTAISGLVDAWLSASPVEVNRQLDQIDHVHPDKSAELIALRSEEFEMVHTHAWKLIRNQNGSVQLYAKPDDRWEINDVSDRCPLIVEKLVDLLDRRIGFERPIDLSIRLEDDLVMRKD